MAGKRLSCRASLASLGGLVAGAAGIAGWRSAEDAGAGPAGVASGLVTCVLAPEQTEGPYYVRIHTMVHLGGNVVHTGQLYFSDAVTNAVYRPSPYSGRPNRSPRNSGDSIYRNGGKRSTLKLVKKGTVYTGSITMGFSGRSRLRCPRFTAC